MTSPPRSPGRRRSRFLALALGTVGALALLLLAELGVRLAAEPEDLRPIRILMPVIDGTALRPDPDVFWLLGPDPDGEINALGLRGPVPEPAGATIQILCLGDSCTFGSGVPYELGYPFLLERKLQALVRDRVVEVVRGAVPGHSSFQSLRLLNRHLAQLRPQLAVLYLGAWNDGAPTTHLRDSEVHALSAAPWGQRSALVHWLARVLARAPGDGDAAREALRHARLAAAAPEFARVPIAEFRENVRQMAGELLARGATVFGVVPAQGANLLARTPWMADYGHALAEELARLQCEALDAPRLFAQVAAERGLPGALPEGSPGPFLQDEVHPDIAGHELIAERLAVLLAPAVRRLCGDPREARSPAERGVQVEEVTPDHGAPFAPTRITLRGAGLDALRAHRLLVAGKWVPGATFDGPDRIRATLPPLPPGRHPLVVFTAGGPIRSPIGFLAEPCLEFRADDARNVLTLRLRARPSMGYWVFVGAGLLPAPVPTAFGAFALSPPIAMLLSGTIAPDGTVAIDLPTPGRLGDPVPIQVLMQDGTRVFLLDPARVTPR